MPDTQVEAIEVTTSRLAKTPILSGIVHANDFYLHQLILMTPRRNIDIRGMMVEASYYEDIFKGSVSGHILMSDAINVIDVNGLSGNEFLKFSFRKSKEEDVNEINKYFRVYRVGERILNNNQTENYTLHFCSEELFLSEQTKISKSYSNIISDIVYDILSNHLKIDDKRINVNKTEGIYDFVVPYKKPFETINWLANYAIRTKPTEARAVDYVFFEDASGFNFVSLSNLMLKPAYQSYIYGPKNINRDKKSQVENLGIDFFGIKSYTFLDTFDTLYGTVSGAFSNRLITVDPLLRQHRSTTFDYLKDYQNVRDSQTSSPLVNNLKNRLDKTQNENYDAVLKVMVSNSNQKFADGIESKSSAVSSDVRVETYVPNRTAQIALSHYIRLKLSLAGDPHLTVGRTIQVELPSTGINDDASLDQQYSGKYLITAVRHIISSQMKYETIVEVARDSFAKRLGNFIGSDKLLSKAIKGEK